MSARLFLSDTPGKTIFLWGFVICLFGGIAGFFINFVPFEGLFIPSVILATGITAYIALQLFLLMRSGGNLLLQSPGSVVFGCILAFGIAGLAFFLLIFVSLPALATQVFGEPYRAEDRVVKVEDCRGRRCAFCKRHLELEKHAGYRFCLDEGELPRLKAGDGIVVVGSSSSLGIRIKAFASSDVRPR